MCEKGECGLHDGHCAYDTECMGDYICGVNNMAEFHPEFVSTYPLFKNACVHGKILIFSSIIPRLLICIFSFKICVFQIF